MSKLAAENPQLDGYGYDAETKEDLPNNLLPLEIEEGRKGESAAAVDDGEVFKQKKGICAR